MSSPPRWRRGRAPRRGLWRRVCDYGLTIILLGVLALFAARLDRQNMRTREGAAIVKDGDSITLGGERIRLLGIDAPEYSQTCQRNGVDYACGKRAREALVQLIGGRSVTCTGTRHDRYGRLLGDCMAGEVNLNRAQVEAGWAVAYGGYQAEEAAARVKKVGIWAGTFEQPQDWRRHRNAAPEPKHDDFLARIGDWLRQTLRFW